MKKNRIFIWAIPVLVILMGLVIYQYGFLRIKEELNLIREEQESKAKTLQKYLAIIAEKPDLEKRLITIKDQRRAETAKLMEGETFSLAAAALQDMVKGIITSRGGIISSERIGKEEEIVSGPKKEESKGPKTEKGFKVKKEKYEDKRRFKVVSASFDFTAPDTGALRDIVFFVETRTPYLVIKELDCRVRNFREPRELMVKLDVSALYGGK